MKKKNTTPRQVFHSKAVYADIRLHPGGLSRAELDALFPFSGLDRVLTGLRDSGRIACTNGTWWARSPRPKQAQSLKG